MAQINIKDLSQELDTTPRMTRRFLRHITPTEEQPGKGGRWAIEKRDVRSLKKKFEAFSDEHIRSVNTDTGEINEKVAEEVLAD